MIQSKILALRAAKYDSKLLRIIFLLSYISNMNWNEVDKTWNEANSRWS